VAGNPGFAHRREQMTQMMIVQGDDWQGIYIDGKLKTEGHQIELLAGINIAIENKVDDADSAWCDLTWLHERGDLPQDLKDVEWEK
jgi:hypothetical protein